MSADSSKAKALSGATGRSIAWQIIAPNDSALADPRSIASVRAACGVQHRDDDATRQQVLTDNPAKLYGFEPIA